MNEHMQVDIDPPTFGPLRLGMTEAESIEVLRTLGELRVGGPHTHFAFDPTTGLLMHATSENGIVMWIAGDIDEEDRGYVKYSYAGVNLNQPFRNALRELLGLGIPILTDEINYVFAVEAAGLSLPIAGEDRDYFSGPVLTLPSSLRELTGAKIPFTLPDLDTLVYEYEYEEESET